MTKPRTLENILEAQQLSKARAEAAGQEWKPNPADELEIARLRGESLPEPEPTDSGDDEVETAPAENE